MCGFDMALYSHSFRSLLHCLYTRSLLTHGCVYVAEIAASELFGSHQGQSQEGEVGVEQGSAPPTPPDLGPKGPGILKVTQHGSTTVTWLDGPLWIVGVDAQVRG